MNAFIYVFGTLMGITAIGLALVWANDYVERWWNK